MNLPHRISAFVQLGNKIRSLSPAELEELFGLAGKENPWFKAEQITTALQGIARWLNEEALSNWFTAYNEPSVAGKTIGLAMAGNIPLVGFHDLLCVLISGHRVKVKSSSLDSALPRYLMSELIRIEPAFRDSIEWSERLLGLDAMIATGSDNTARYFEYYFRHIPHIIRKNRSSCAVILGEESPAELRALGLDVFAYFGLGCRNVSKLFIPEKYDVTLLFEPWEVYRDIIHHSKYFNNYEYQKSILLVNRIPFFDNGFVLLKDDASLVSPISVVFTETYADQPDIRKKINSHQEKIQCIVSARGWYPESVVFGQAQFPGLTDYSDKVDTMKFLTSL